MSLRGLVGGTFDMASARLILTSTPGPSGSGGRVGVGERGACTLLGPEGPDACLSGWCLTLWALELPAVVGGFGGAARTLRTTQWTRASLQDDLSGLSCVDDLKDH